MKIKQSLIFIIFLFFLGCSKGVIDPNALAPQNPHSTWVKATESLEMSSKYCEALMPKNLQKDKLSLAELIDIGLLNNPNTKASWAEARSKAASYGQTLAGYYPEINGIATYDRSRESNVLPGSSQTFTNTTYTPELNITYTVFDFGKRKNISLAARQALYFADYSHNRQIQNIIKTIMDDYYDLENQKQQLLSLEKDLYNANTSLDAAFEKFEAGTGSIDDITQAKTNYLQTKINLMDQKRALKISYATLINDLGLPANINIKVEDFPEYIQTQLVLENVDDLIQKAQKNRYDFLANEANVKENEANLSLAKSQSFPTIDASFDLGKNYYQHHHAEDYHYTFILKLSCPIFKGFYDRNEVLKQKANVQKAKAQLTQLELEMIKEITTAHYSVKIAAENLEYSKEYLEAALKRFDIAILKYKEGLNDILDVLSAQSFLQDARKKYVNAQSEWYSSIAELAYSTGTICSGSGNDI